MGPVVQFHAFDAAYVESLRAGDPATQEHFVGYFSDLLQIKLRSRLRSPQEIEDVRQETFFRVLKTIEKEGALRDPERLGPFVVTVCNNVLFEQYRRAGRTDSLDEEGAPELPARGRSVLEVLEEKERRELVLKVLEGLDSKDRAILIAVFIEERDRTDVCKEFGVDRGYLRVLLYRAKHDLKAAFLKRNGNQNPFVPAPREA